MLYIFIKNNFFMTKLASGIVTTSHQKGGVGKSTIMWELIIQYSKQQIVDFIDLDVQKTITLSLENREKNYEALSNINILNVRDENDKINNELMLELMIKSEKKKRLLFIDSGGFDSSANRLAMAASNVLLTPVSSKFFELLGLKKYELILKQLTSELRDDQKLICNVILNKINPKTKWLDEVTTFINSSEHFNLMNSVIRQRVDFEDAPGVGQSVVEYNKNSMAAMEILNLKKELDIILKAY
jgi:chromosome partitioning protein